MQKTFDLARIAEDIESPYRPTSLATVADVQASLFVCDDRRSWHRNESHDAMMLVIEGVLVVDSGSGRVVANEGEFFTVPRSLNHNLSAGMRSSVMLLEAMPSDIPTNGHAPLPPNTPVGTVEKTNVAGDVLRGTPYDWLAVGIAGRCGAVASRLWGKSAPYRPPEDALLIVYRGVLDYRLDGEEGTVVGSQMLLIPSGSTMTLESERGATVLLVARDGSSLPEAVSSGAPSAGGGRAES